MGKRVLESSSSLEVGPTMKMLVDLARRDKVRKTTVMRVKRLGEGMVIALRRRAQLYCSKVD